MGLISGNTHWMFVLGSSSGESEERHIYDVAFGVCCLEVKGVNFSQISIYIDGIQRPRIDSILGPLVSNSYPIHVVNDLFTHLQANRADNIVLFVTGHGGLDGIDSVQKIKPHSLVSGMKAAPNLKLAVVYLGQCYAGIFDYMGVSKRLDSNQNLISPDVIFMGATNLSISLSGSTQDTMANGVQKNWLANLFLYQVFRWILNPIDVDGDGMVSVMDSYKFAGMMSSESSRSCKRQSAIRNMMLQPILMERLSKSNADPSNLQLKFDFESVAAEYDQHLNNRYSTQDCWILNSLPAQKIAFD